MVHLDVSNDGHIAAARVVAYGSLPRPTRLVDVERQIEAAGLGTSLRLVGEACRDSIRPSGDMHGSAGFKGHLFQVMCRRAVAEALEKLRAA
jgi:CO/xanthine dehydrogenase FAD-binding subunit